MQLLFFTILIHLKACFIIAGRWYILLYKSLVYCIPKEEEDIFVFFLWSLNLQLRTHPWQVLLWTSIQNNTATLFRIMDIVIYNIKHTHNTRSSPQPKKNAHKTLRIYFSVVSVILFKFIQKVPFLVFRKKSSFPHFITARQLRTPQGKQDVPYWIEIYCLKCYRGLDTFLCK